MPVQAGDVTLDGSGNGTIRLDPAPIMRHWVYDTVSVSISTGEISALTGGECRMYRGEISPGNFLSGSRTPWLDTATFGGRQARITSPNYFTVQFTNCDPGAVATVIAMYHVE